jgi:hypothetical protein
MVIPSDPVVDWPSPSVDRSVQPLADLLLGHLRDTPAAKRRLEPITEFARVHAQDISESPKRAEILQRLFDWLKNTQKMDLFLEHPDWANALDSKSKGLLLLLTLERKDHLEIAVQILENPEAYVPRSVAEYNTIFSLVAQTGHLSLIKICLSRPDFKEHLTHQTITRAWMDSRHDLNLYDAFVTSRLSTPSMIRLFKQSVRKDKAFKAVERFFIHWHVTDIEKGSPEELCIRELFGNSDNYMDFSRRDLKTLQGFATWYKIPLVESLIKIVFDKNPAPILSQRRYGSHPYLNDVATAQALDEIAHQVAHFALPL